MKLIYFLIPFALIGSSMGYFFHEGMNFGHFFFSTLFIIGNILFLTDYFHTET
jgi:drug/metabolite transporter (DMT)-like permease